MIAGLEDISEGEFKIDDRVVNDVAKIVILRLVFQNYALIPTWRSMIANMAFGLKLRKYSKEEIKNVYRMQLIF